MRSTPVTYLSSVLINRTPPHSLYHSGVTKRHPSLREMGAINRLLGLIHLPQPIPHSLSFGILPYLSNRTQCPLRELLTLVRLHVWFPRRPCIWLLTTVTSPIRRVPLFSTYEFRGRANSNFRFVIGSQWSTGLSTTSDATVYVWKICQPSVAGEHSLPAPSLIRIVPPLAASTPPPVV